MTSHPPPSTVITLTVDTPPDAYLDLDHVVLELTAPVAGGTDAVVRIPLEWAEEWAIDAYASIMAAYRSAVGADVPLVKTPPLDRSQHGDDGRCSSSLGSPS